jgi:hypothetical protein
VQEASVQQVAGQDSALWFLVRPIFNPEDGSDMLLRNVSSHTVCTAP